MKEEPRKKLSEVELFLLKLNACYEPELSVKGTQKAIQIIEDLQQRIDKAIEYIKSYRDENTNWYEFTIQNKIELLEILGDGINEREIN